MPGPPSSGLSFFSWPYSLSHLLTRPEGTALKISLPQVSSKVPNEYHLNEITIYKHLTQGQLLNLFILPTDFFFFNEGLLGNQCWGHSGFSLQKAVLPGLLSCFSRV